MQSDSPRIDLLQGACREYDATLLLDCAHDLGAIGPGGTGQLGIQKMLGKVDLVMGTFSTTFASNGGFLASNSEPALRYVRAFGNTWTFSNALSPIQVAVVRQALRMVRSKEGERLRGQLMTNVLALRERLTADGLVCIGEPSAVVPVLAGDDRVARIASGLLHKEGVHVNLIEFPGVPIDASRFRLQVMATHTHEHVRWAAGLLAAAISEASSATAINSAAVPDRHQDV
jgi:7-keto-8-aminopelargonate synthetase-like enzyme